jgi:Mrp family chromosome partitioning ATPase/protein involved in polysaccharide export with SLBB domain
MQEFNIDSSKLQMETEEKGASFFDFEKIKMVFVLHWKWFIPSVVICLLLAMYYLWVTPTTISVTGKMQLIDKQGKSSSSNAGMAILSSLPLGLGNSISSTFGGSMGIDIEKEILTSTDLVLDVVYDLNLYTTYKVERWGRSTQLYKDQPVKVTLDRTHLLWMDRELPLNYHQAGMTITKDDKGYQVTGSADGKPFSKRFTSLPVTIRTEVGSIMIADNDQLTASQRKAYAKGFELKANIAPPMIVAKGYISRMVVEPPKKGVTNLLTLTLRDESMIRGMEFITRLVAIYNRRGKEDVDEQNRKTDQFVNDRLAKINVELGLSDDDYQHSKEKYKITAPEAEASEALSKKNQYEEQLIQIGIQLQLQDYMNEFAQNPANIYEVIPVVSGGMSFGSNMGGSMSAGGGQALSRHNTLAFQRKELLKSLSEKAHQVQRVTELIEELRPTLLTELSRMRQAIVIQRQNVEREYKKAMERIGSAPRLERVFTDIERLREIKQGVYVVMLQKREELAMNRVDASNKGKLIEKVQVNGGSDLPKRNFVLLIALVLGIIIPFLAILLLFFLKNKVETRNDLEKSTKFPILGEIPTINNEESLRTLRTNLLLHLQEDQKTILVTSNAVGDGKTYHAIRLAEGLGRLDKKVILCDLNLRRPGIAQALSIPEKSSAFELLNKGMVSATDIQSQTVQVEGFDVLVAGKSGLVHPSDLLARHSLVQLMDILKSQYDYVVIDSPALADCSDTYQLATQADATCFVVKADHTLQSVVKHLDPLNRLPDKLMIFNAIDMTKKKYKYLYRQVLALLSVVLLFSSCSVKNFAYFQGAKNVDLNQTTAFYDARIMPKDQLNIHVYTITPEASAPFNMGSVSVGSSNTGGSSASSGGSQSYLVSNDGTINFPVLGRIKVVGLTKDECEDMILEQIRPYMAPSEKPIVTVRQANYTITVLGEVGSPGTIQVTREKINIYEALAQAGDLTVTGKRVNVKLFRENANGTRELHLLDLTDANIMNSPYFYLQQNDMIYVEPNIVKKQSGNIVTSLIIPLTTTLVSFSALLIALFK